MWGKHPSSRIAAHLSCLLKETSKSDQAGSFGSKMWSSVLTTFKHALLCSLHSRLDLMETSPLKIE